MLLSLPVRCGVCLCVALTAFGQKSGRQLWRLCGLFTGATLVLGGCMLALSLALRREGMLQNGFLYSEISAPVMFISFPAVYLLSTYVLGRGRADVGRSTRELRFLLGERSLSLRALNDSGNLLRDPFSGSRVIVLSAGEAAALFPEKAAELLRRGGDPEGPVRRAPLAAAGKNRGAERAAADLPPGQGLSGRQGSAGLCGGPDHGAHVSRRRLPGIDRSVNYEADHGIFSKNHL